MVDAADSKSAAARRASSSLASGTSLKIGNLHYQQIPRLPQNQSFPEIKASGIKLFGRKRSCCRICDGPDALTDLRESAVRSRGHFMHIFYCGSCALPPPKKNSLRLLAVRCGMFWCGRARLVLCLQILWGCRGRARRTGTRELIRGGG